MNLYFPRPTTHTLLVPLNNQDYLGSVWNVEEITMLSVDFSEVNEYHLT